MHPACSGLQIHGPYTRKPSTVFPLWSLLSTTGAPANSDHPEQILKPQSAELLSWQGKKRSDCFSSVAPEETFRK